MNLRNFLGFLLFFVFFELSMNLLIKPILCQTKVARKPLSWYYKTSGREINSSGDFSRAMKLAQRELAKNPSNQKALGLKVKILVDNRRTVHKGKKMAKAACKKFPHNLQFQFLFAKSLYYMEENQQARQALKKCLAMRKNHLGSLTLLADVEHRLHNDEESLKLIDQAIGIEPDSVSLQYQKAKIYLHRKEYKKALVILNAVLIKHPRAFSLRQKRAAVYSLQKQWHKAIKDYSRLIDDKVIPYTIYEKRGYAYEQIGKFDLALKDYTAGLAKAPNHRPFLVGRVRCYQKLGKSELAKKDKLRLRSLDKDLVPFSFQPDWTGRDKKKYKKNKKR